MTRTYYRRIKGRLRERAMKGVAGRERKRREREEAAGNWEPLGVMLVVMRAAPDGRRMALAVHERMDWTVCGTERAVRSALARAMWGKKSAVTGGMGER
jgi:hypothetical protein